MVDVRTQAKERINSMSDTRVKCICGEWLSHVEHSQYPDTIVVEAHVCESVILFNKCDYKGTFANCKPGNCTDCSNIKSET